MPTDDELPRAGAFVARRPGAADAAPTREAAVLGLLAALGADPAVTDILVNGGEVWADRGRGLERSSAMDLDPASARELAVRLVGLGGRHVDEATPVADARLPGGLRVHVALAPIASPAPLISIRLAALRVPTLDDLDRSGAFGPGVRARLEGLVADRANVLVTGAAGTGKTTLLGALLSLAAPSERIVVIEDVAEVRSSHPHVVALEARQPNLEGAGAIELPRLVREALRMRPDRLVLGECRGAEIRDLLAAFNTGHDGGIGTVHANSLADVPARLEALGALAGLDAVAIARQTASAIGAVVHLERDGPRRRVAGIGRCEIDAGERLAVVPWP